MGIIRWAVTSVSFTAEQSKMVPITVAEYTYDKQGVAG